jgi:DNA polymerase-3 subunit epsilon
MGYYINKMNEFITIDFETATYKPESAISIGLVKYCDFQVIDTYYSLIRPPRLYIRPDFTDIHGLTVEDVKDARHFNHLWESDISGFIGKTLLAAHNADFDMNVLKSALEYYELPVPALNYFCTCNMARRVFRGFDSYKLTLLAKRFNIVYNAHNALDDAMTCGKLVQIAFEKYGAEKTIEELLKDAGLGIKRLGG